MGALGLPYFLKTVATFNYIGGGAGVYSSRTRRPEFAGSVRELLQAYYVCAVPLSYVIIFYKFIEARKKA